MSDWYLADLEERFVRYVKVDTQADESSPTNPSTAIQLDLQRILVDELNALGASDVRLTDYGAVIATIPATVDGRHSHRSRSWPMSIPRLPIRPAMSGQSSIATIRAATSSSREKPPVAILADETPYLATQIGNDIVTSSGDTLLGADDKAGVAIVMAMAKHLLQDTSIPHGTIRVCFTPDEEIGRGVHAESSEGSGS